MTSKKNRTLFDHGFLNVFNSINLQSLFVYDNSINLAIDFNLDKVNIFLSNINNYGTALSDSVISQRLILNVPIKEPILGLPTYSTYKSTGKFNIEFLKHIYDASVDSISFTNKLEDEIYLDVSFLDFYSMSVAYFLLELYKNSTSITIFKSICRSIATAIKNKVFTLNFTRDTTSFELVNCSFTDVFNYYGKEPSDFEDSTFIAKVSSDSFALLNTNYRIYSSISSVSYDEHYAYLLQETDVTVDTDIFVTSSPFLIQESIPEYFKRLSSNSLISTEAKALVRNIIDSLFILESTKELNANKVKPITFNPVDNIFNIYSKPFNINFFGSDIKFFMNFNNKSKSICTSNFESIYFSSLYFSDHFGSLSDSIITKAKEIGLYKDSNNKLNTLSSSKLYLIDPSYNYSIFSLGKGTTRALPFSPYVFFKENPYNKNQSSINSPLSTFTSVQETGNTKHYYVRSIDFNILFSFYSYSLGMSPDEDSFDIKSNYNADSKIAPILDYAFNQVDSLEVNLVTYFYYLLKDSSNQESMHLIMGLFD